MPPSPFSNQEEFLKRLPKTDLHVHLDGSPRITTLIEIAKANNIELPSYTEDGLRELVYKNEYNDLTDYLSGFQYITVSRYLRFNTRTRASL